MAASGTKQRRVVTARSSKRYAAVCCPRCGIGTPLLIRRNTLACPTCSYREPLPTDIRLNRSGAVQLPFTL